MFILIGKHRNHAFYDTGWSNDRRDDLTDASLQLAVVGDR